jgi:hypothetical protein
MSQFQVKRGCCYVYFAYDVGQWIDLEACRRLGARGAESAHIRHKHAAPSYFQFRPAPVRVTEAITPIPLGGRRTSSTVEAVLFDFGAVSLAYCIPVSGTLADLADLSASITEQELLRKDSRERVDQLGQIFGAAITKLQVADLTEDYLVFQLVEYDAGCGVESIPERHGQMLARALRGEREALSSEEVQDATARRVSFGPGDVTLIDWNAAFVLDTEADDVRAVLEFSNVELLELRFLDLQLDRALDEAYDLLNASRWRQLRLPGASRAGLRRIGQMQVDGAILFERVTNALKLLGDQYLARVHHQASQRFRLEQWNTSILRKLDTIESIYQKIHDRASGLRMEILEWIIILLIALSIVLPFIPGFGSH